MTFRTADSIPKEKLAQWIEERKEFEREHPKPWSAESWRLYRTEFLDRIERWSDLGHGACLLKQPQLREIVTRALAHFDDRPENPSRRYQLGDFVVMPNHVHLLVRPLEPWRLGQLIHSWKSYTAKAIHRLTGGSGPFWQDERFDHVVRRIESLDTFAAYIANNPKRAGLEAGDYTVGLASRQSPPDGEDWRDASPT